MAWNKLPKGKIPKPQFDQFDLEAMREGDSIRKAMGPIGPVGKRIAKMRRNHDRGNAITENKATRHIEVR